MKIQTLNESNSFSWFGKYFDLKGNKKFIYITKDLTRDAQEASEILEDRIPEPFTKFVFCGSINTNMAKEQGATLVEATFTADELKQKFGTANIDIINAGREEEPVQVKDYQLFYDKHLRLWTVYIIDEEGNQISDTEYASNRHDALELLNNKDNFRLRESLNEALGRDYSHIPEVEKINYSNNKNGNLLPYLDCNAFKAALEEIGLEAFKIKSARLKGVSKADLKDEFGGRGMAPWKWINDFDSSVPMGQGNEFDIFFKGEFPKVEEKLEVNEEEKLTEDSDAKLIESEDGWVKRFNWADKYYKDDYVISAIPGYPDATKIAHWHVEKVRPNGSTISHLGNYSSLEKAKEVVDALPSKQISEDIEVPTLEGPNEGAEYGLSELLNSAIQHELETVNEYNVLALNARAEGFDDIASVIDEINTEENKHIGQLQELLKLVSPNAQAIVAGETEASDDLVQVDNNLE